MQEATVTETNEAVNSGNISLVTQDDLEREIGRWVISGLNKDKMIAAAVVQINKLTIIANEFKAKADAADADLKAKDVTAEGVSKSNVLLAGKNAALNESIEKLKAEVKSEKASAAASIRTTDKAQASADSLQIKLEEAKSDIEKKDTNIQVLTDGVKEKNEKIKTLNAEVKALKAKKKTVKKVKNG